jgi:hypothetical protein
MGKGVGGMNIDIEKDNVKQGVLGLVLALVEIIRDVLGSQAVRRMEGGGLSDEEVERLGMSLMEIDNVIEQLKEENRVSDVVRDIRNKLDGLLEGVIDGRSGDCPYLRTQ